ncbi:OprD family porin [Pseudomonas sp. MF4836]|uniref:OprD family porin n=1 Tax=Pseudomonas sp. MF4836 TaxID=1960827 RepID=UPI0009989844|nr:OprD family porin [Pseudomonas sp. MF4836]OOV89917.1 porin [Pseudomonas sp. MF4836]
MRQPTHPHTLLLLPLLCSLPLAAAAGEGESGFIEDSHLTLLSRNYYLNRSIQDGRRDRKDWTQGFIARFSSGFTQGTVGVGVDAFGTLGLKLDASGGKIGTYNLPVHDNGKPADEYSKGGAALKLRISETVLRYGEQSVDTPVFAVGHNRLIPQAATGFALDSREVQGLKLRAGHFTSASGHVTTNSDGDLWAFYAGVTTPSVDYLGADYQFSDKLGASLYTARFADIWNQYYANFNGSTDLDDRQQVGFDLNLYRTVDTGQAKAGAIDNTTLGASVFYGLGAHRLTLALQNVDGNTPFDYLGVGDIDRNGRNGRDQGASIYLPNSAQYSDFNGPNERSWQLRYDLAMDSYGVPGLKLMARYLRGSGIDGTHMPVVSPYAGFYGKDGTHRETNLEARYVVQSGPLKDLSLRLRQTWHRANAAQGEGNIDEFRLITDYPLDIF